jgi:hypothetical protein
MDPIDRSVLPKELTLKELIKAPISTPTSTNTVHALDPTESLNLSYDTGESLAEALSEDEKLINQVLAQSEKDPACKTINSVDRRALFQQFLNEKNKGADRQNLKQKFSNLAFAACSERMNSVNISIHEGRTDRNFIPSLEQTRSMKIDSVLSLFGHARTLQGKPLISSSGSLAIGPDSTLFNQHAKELAGMNKTSLSEYCQIEHIYPDPYEQREALAKILEAIPKIQRFKARTFSRELAINAHQLSLYCPAFQAQVASSIFDHNVKHRFIILDSTKGIPPRNQKAFWYSLSPAQEILGEIQNSPHLYNKWLGCSQKHSLVGLKEIKDRQSCQNSFELLSL